MNIHYIFHSGFLVETETCYYMFDYYKGAIPPLDVYKPIVVLSSHGHKDHYNPEVFSILRKMGMRDVLAVLAKDIPEKRYPRDAAVLKVYANKTYALPHGETLETLLSTDSGVAFLLTAEEGVIYHAGDLNDWSWAGEDENENRQMRANYRHEIDKLKGRRIDVAFVVLDPRQGENYDRGLLYFLKTVDAGRVYPIHYWEQPAAVGRFLKDHPEHRGIVQYLEQPEEEINHEV